MSLSRFASLALLLAVATGLPGFGQSRRPAPADEPLASFTGTIREIDNKSLTIDGPGSNALQLYFSRKTRCYQGTAKLDRSLLKTGDQVSVDARRALDGTMEAVIVHREPRKPL